MNLKQKITRIKDRVTIKDVLDFYNTKQNTFKKNYHCPFHGEDKNPSASISRGVFHCFTCGKSWDVLGFVQEYEKCSLSTAIKILDKNFHCGCYERLSDEEYKKIKEEEWERKKKQLKLKFWKEFEEQKLNEVYKNIKFWEIVQEDTKELYYEVNGKKINFTCWFFKSIKRLDWLYWLYDILCDLSPPMCEFNYIYGTDKKTILRKIYKKEIKI